MFLRNYKSIKIRETNFDKCLYSDGLKLRHIHNTKIKFCMTLLDMLKL